MKIYNTFTQKYVDHACRINPNLQIVLDSNGPLKYIKIKNFLENAEDLKEFLLHFPAIDRFKSIEEEDDFIKNEYVNGSKAPGIQQIIPNHYLKSIQLSLHKILNDLNFCRYNYDPDLWDFYTNYLDPNIKSFESNNLAHTDPFTYACNIYLTEVENTGTQFFKFKGLKKDFYDTNSLMRDPEELEYFKSSNIYSDPRKYNKLNFKDWEVFNGNEYLHEYHYIPAEYNSVTIYKGCFWHSIKYDAKNSTKVRYSLVGAIK